MRKIFDNFVDIWYDYNHFVAILLIVGCIVVGVGCAFGVLCLHSWLIMLLWNWVAVELFGAPVLSFWFAMGLTCLISLLFKKQITVRKNDD